MTAAIQGSGWGWLGYNPETKKLEIVTTPNQDPLLSHVPIIGIDIWEHAFYLQYHNVKADVSLFLPHSRPRSSLLDSRRSACCSELVADLCTQYLTAIWNVINFKEAERRFLEAAMSA